MVGHGRNLGRIYYTKVTANRGTEVVLPSTRVHSFQNRADCMADIVILPRMLCGVVEGKLT